MREWLGGNGVFTLWLERTRFTNRLLFVRLPQELQAERPDEKCYMDKDMLERMMFARLSMGQVDEETPFQYIIGCVRACGVMWRRGYRVG